MIVISYFISTEVQLHICQSTLNWTYVLCKEIMSKMDFQYVMLVTLS